MNVISYPDRLFLINLPQKFEGSEQFISAWFFRDKNEKTFLVDPGPASTIPDLCAALEGLTDRLDYVLLTHIHLDHSGGVGHLLEKYPCAKILVSDKGKKHLISPEKLWRASIDALGDIALIYGAPLPVPSEAILDGHIDGVEVFETPGHASHHISFRVQNWLFIGEAAGMTEESSVRPTVPVRFDAEAARKSLELLISVCADDDILCYSHWGAYRTSSIRSKASSLSIKISRGLVGLDGCGPKIPSCSSVEIIRDARG